MQSRPQYHFHQASLGADRTLAWTWNLELAQGWSSRESVRLSKYSLILKHPWRAHEVWSYRPTCFGCNTERLSSRVGTSGSADDQPRGAVRSCFQARQLELLEAVP